MRTLLGRFLFSGDDVYKKIAELSGGARRRVALAKLVLDRPDFVTVVLPHDVVIAQAGDHIPGQLRRQGLLAGPG